jgi:hypothetical protein
MVISTRANRAKGRKSDDAAAPVATGASYEGLSGAEWKSIICRVVGTHCADGRDLSVWVGTLLTRISIRCRAAWHYFFQQILIFLARMPGLRNHLLEALDHAHSSARPYVRRHVITRTMLGLICAFKLFCLDG